MKCPNCGREMVTGQVEKCKRDEVDSGWRKACKNLLAFICFK